MYPVVTSVMVVQTRIYDNAKFQAILFLKVHNASRVCKTLFKLEISKEIVLSLNDGQYIFKIRHR